MGDISFEGYHAVFQDLRARAARADSEAERLREVQRDLMRVFDEVGNPLGDDQYGAALHGGHHKRQQGLRDAFTSCIREVEQLRDGLRENVKNYENAEHLRGG
ncbi:hypothetical protein OUY22_02935 [Nonomuraea sp. MCN248]|uniref:PE domain-containing protein n=1 Tax=Nonomuraea corallina TaxID=2989783 RepID=A0ABT4S580_9ACTN|nr:hypothetical protein [Nonomuraea corallina]MDA0632356.1 hypothetical protein [Nonomuraea corallina]